MIKVNGKSFDEYLHGLVNKEGGDRIREYHKKQDNDEIIPVKSFDKHNGFRLRNSVNGRFIKMEKSAKKNTRFKLLSPIKKR